MNVGPMPAVAIGTLSGNLPKSATTAAGPLPGANGAPASESVGLNQNNALQDVTLTPFPTMQFSPTSSALSFSPSQLSFLQDQFEEQSEAALSTQADSATNFTV